MNKKVLIGLSGGVDSAVAATLLKQQGYEVIGVTLKLLEYTNEESIGCCTAADVIDATRVCDTVGVEHLVISRKKSFKQKIIDTYLDGHRQGVFHNPCITCNTTIKLPSLFEIADHMGIPYVATGHYARIENGLIKRAKDLSKDQSYFLWETPPEQINRLLFPLGEYTKTEVRELARKFGLRVADKKDSTNLCFLEGGTKEEFMERHNVGTEQGEIIDNQTGTVLGHHAGYSKYVPGQRTGIGASASGKPRYVLRVIPSTNQVVVGTKEEAASNVASIRNARWINGSPSTLLRGICRYGQKENLPDVQITSCNEDNWTVKFNTDIHGIASGQSLVLYDTNDCVVGGGFLV